MGHPLHSGVLAGPNSIILAAKFAKLGKLVNLSKFSRNWPTNLDILAIHNRKQGVMHGECYAHSTGNARKRKETPGKRMETVGNAWKRPEKRGNGRKHAETAGNARKREETQGNMRKRAETARNERKQPRLDRDLTAT